MISYDEIFYRFYIHDLEYFLNGGVHALKQVSKFKSFSSSELQKSWICPFVTAIVLIDSDNKRLKYADLSLPFCPRYFGVNWDKWNISIVSFRDLARETGLEDVLIQPTAVFEEAVDDYLFAYKELPNYQEMRLSVLSGIYN